MMRSEEAYAKIISNISITRQIVTIAKANLFPLFEENSDTSSVINRFLNNFDAQMPDKIILNEAVDPTRDIEKAGKSISWRVASSEAIWELIHDNHLFPTTSNLITGSITLQWTQIYGERGSGTTASWNFDRYRIPIPQTVIPSVSRKSLSEILVNPDLYLQNINIPDLHPDIDQALREAVRCFKYDLFTASIAMLGKASEGAWLELGEALIRALSPSDVESIRKQKGELENPAYGVGKKIDTILSLYARQDLYSTIAENCGVSVKELRIAANWSDAVRDSRNTIHFGVEPSVPNTYEKVAALLLGVIPYLRLIFRIKAVCDSNNGT